ncbi:MAG: hypothetical protein GY937_20210, partial [bacterium]|nr:hypothetical protein [bacterium]
MEQALLERGMSVQVKVFAKDCCHALLYSGTEANEQVYLYLHDGHYDIIKSPSGFFNTSFYCKHCDKAYSNRYKHRCKYVCTKCDARVPCAIDERKHCAICNCNFNSVECYDRHLAVNQGSSRCMRFKLCRMCGKGYPTNRQHVCGAAKCRNCGKFYKETHYCFIQPIVDKPKKKRVAPGEQLEGSEGEMDPDDLEAMVIEAERLDGEKPVTDEKPQCFIFFDIEVQQNTELTTDANGSVFLHVPNAVVAQKCCEFCEDLDIEVACVYCGKDRSKIWYGENCHNEFCAWLFGGDNEKCVAMAHNAKGYDAQFLMQYLFSQGVVPKIVP